tara:strand:- start:403 stop:522 length:120 start_codon:yes stop_codon:yes gene_type:complete
LKNSNIDVAISPTLRINEKKEKRRAPNYLKSLDFLEYQI